MVTRAVDVEIVEVAAHWLLTNYQNVARPLLPSVKKQFGLSWAEAVAAIRLANYMRGSRNLAARVGDLEEGA